jgi:hypothetical protein
MINLFWLQPDSMFFFSSNFWQTGQISGPSIWFVALSTLLVVYQPVRQSMAFFFSPGVTLAFLQNKLHVFLDNAFLDRLGILCSTLWFDGLKPFLI